MCASANTRLLELITRPEVVKQYVRGGAPELYLELSRRKAERVRRELRSIQRWLARHRPATRSLRETLRRLIAAPQAEILHSGALDSWIDAFVGAATASLDLTRLSTRLSKITALACAPDAHQRFRLLAATDVLLLGDDRRYYYCPWEPQPMMLRDLLKRAFETCVVLSVQQNRLSPRDFAAAIAHLTDAMFTLRDYATPTVVGERVLDAIASTIPALRSFRTLRTDRHAADGDFVRWLRSRYDAAATANLDLLLYRAVNDQRLIERWRVVGYVVANGVNTPKRRDVLLRGMKDVDRSVRWRAIEGLRRLRDSGAIHAIRDALTDGDDWVRWHARRALMTQPRAAAVIRGLLTDVSGPRLQAALLECLTRVSKRNDDLQIFVRAARHPHDAVRAAAIPYLAQRENVRHAPDEVFDRLHDPARNVRLTSLVAALRMHNLDSLPVEAVSNALADVDQEIRSAAALLLSRVRPLNGAIVAELVQSLASAEFACDAFERLARSSPAHLEQCDPKVLASVVAESVARGVLPTIGAKLWKPDAILEFPSRAYPWVDQGVRHSWQSHTTIADHTGVTQLCIHGDWFANVHWVALADIVIAGGCGAPHDEAPASIEGRDVGLVIESGGHTVAIAGMRAWPNLKLTDRVDFLYANSPKVIQTLMYMALAARTTDPNGVDRFASRAAKRFEMRFRADIGAVGFHGLLATPWYTRRGWKSSRYGVRHEKSYGSQRAELTRFREFLGSPRGVRMRAKLASAIVAEIDAVNDTLWRHGLRRYPQGLLQRLGSTDMPQWIARQLRPRS